MRNEAEGEKVLSRSREAARRLSGELRIMAWRMRGMAHAMRTYRSYGRGEWETDVAHLLQYCGEIARLCGEHAERIDTHDRLVIRRLHELAQRVRESDD